MTTVSYNKEDLTMTKEEKRQYIITDTVSAFVNLVITPEAYLMWSKMTICSNTTLIEVLGKFSMQNGIIASKNAMLMLLELGVI